MQTDAAQLSADDRPLSALIPYFRNARTHFEAQVAQIAASIREFGWTNPILTDGDNGIIAGHGRLLAASSAWRKCPSSSWRASAMRRGGRWSWLTTKSR
jgi:hypothetical protein